MALGDFFSVNAGKLIGRRRAVKLSANGTIILPKGVIVSGFYFRNRTANAVTGGIKIGTTAGGVDVVAAAPIAGTIDSATKVASLLPLNNPSATQILYIQAVTAWNSAVVDVVCEYEEMTTRKETYNAQMIGA